MSVLLDKSSFFIGTILFLTVKLYGQNPICGNEQRLILHDVYNIKNLEVESILQAYLARNNVAFRSEIVIPVVVHIVWKTYQENVSDALVLSQIAAINRDFNAQNEDIANVPNEFKNLVGNIGFRFCLAAFDPKGNPTTGIVRTQTYQTEIGTSDDLFSTQNGGSDAWDTNRYLNIWVANTGKLVSGLGTYPNETPPEKTGVIIHPKYFGINNHPQYGLGRVATHEIGHYFGLQHLWGKDSDCETDDEVLDTPKQLKAYTGCPNFPQASCSTSEMFMNFMDYVDDPCMLMFTQGQKERMLATLNTYRSGLLSSNIGCLSEQTKNNNYHLVIVPNPSQGLFTCEYMTSPMKIINYKVFNSLGECIKSEEKLVNKKFELDLSEFSKGLYLLQIEGRVYKLVKI